MMITIMKIEPNIPLKRWEAYKVGDIIKDRSIPGRHSNQYEIVERRGTCGDVKLKGISGWWDEWWFDTKN